MKQRNEKNQFAYYLGAEKGSISFGGADMKFKKNINEEFKWAPISERNYWTITLLDIKKYDRNVNKLNNFRIQKLPPQAKIIVQYVLMGVNQ